MTHNNSPKSFFVIVPIIRKEHFLLKLFNIFKTPQVGIEPTTYRLTADRSTTELLGNRTNDYYKDHFI